MSNPIVTADFVAVISIPVPSIRSTTAPSVMSAATTPFTFSSQLEYPPGTLAQAPSCLKN